MAKTGEFNELECNTPKERLDRVEKTIIKLGKALDGQSYYLGCGWENMLREMLRKEK